MTYQKLLKSALSYSLASAMSVLTASAFAASSGNHSGGAGASNHGASNSNNAAKGLANAYIHSGNPVVNAEDCLHSTGCTISVTNGSATTSYTSMGDIARAAEQAQQSLKDFISTLTITYPVN